MAQLSEHPTRSWRVLGSNPISGSDYSEFTVDSLGMLPGEIFEPGARFSKVPNVFGTISGDMILFVSSKQRRLEARNFALILIFIPFTTYEKTSFTE